MKEYNRACNWKNLCQKKKRYKNLFCLPNNVIRNPVKVFFLITASNQQPVFNWGQVKYSNKNPYHMCKHWTLLF